MDSERWQRVAQLYESALERDPRERGAFLAEAGADDAELRREVESLLAQEKAQLVIDRPMLEAAASVFDEPSDLAVGAHVGPYRIDHLVGAGGMGQVYHATDTRLNRSVALKVLPRALAADPQFRARFDREAHVIAALSHPHICALYDVGSHERTDFLVMEYLQGDTLSARLERGPLPFDQALTLAIEIADALATAHGLGIIHRDLKPSNIILTKSGAKLLDFGLAKPSASPVVYGASHIPTMEPRSVTAQGTILGTLQYMAPEQLEAKDADTRTDIFAFGAVVYEVLTGKKAFEGKSQASLIGAIMHADPAAISASQPLTPPVLDRIVKTCLAKDPDDRWQSARDLLHELQWIRHEPTSAAAIGRPKNTGRLAWVLFTLLGVAVIAAGIREMSRPELHPHVARFTVAAPAGASPPPAGQPYSPSVSPDGTQLVFQIMRNGEPLLAVRRIDAIDARIIPGTERARFPFWSPDSHVVAFFADSKLKKINLSGGPVQTICDVPLGLGGAWNRDGVIVFLRSDTEGFYKVAAAGGAPAPLLVPQSGERFRFRPQFLPDGRRFLYSVLPEAVYLASLDGGVARRVLTGTSMALYAPPGYLLFYQGSTLVAQRFDDDLNRSLADPLPIGEGLSGPRYGGGGAGYSVSENGVLAYRTALEGIRQNQLAWFDRGGRQVGTIGPFPFANFGALDLSSDGEQIAMQSPNGPSPDADIWLFDLRQSQPKQLTFGGGEDRHPIWSPDGRSFVFASRRPGASGLYQKSVGGDQREDLLLRSQTDLWHEHWPTDWSSKGIVYESGIDRNNLDVWILSVGNRKPHPVIREPGNQGEAKVSPDGRWIAYTNEEPAGRPEVFVQSLMTAGAKWRVSTGGGRWPLWRRDGKELFYLAADGNLIAVPIESNATAMRPGVGKALFKTDLSFIGGAGSFGASSDGHRFLIRTAGDSDEAASIVVVSNWLAAVKPR